MLHNIIELESFAAIIARSPQSCPAIILFDFAAAFPSLARAFIWITLEAIGIPNFVICAIRSLYSNNCHFTTTNLGLYFVFTALSGVRQGCPLSSVMFILSTDCLLRMIMDSLPKQDILNGFADDLGFVTHNLFNSMKNSSLYRM